MSDLTVKALQSIREQFEQSAAPGEYPASCAGEMMLLADVAAVLGASEEQTAVVLGPAAFAYVQELLGGPDGPRS